MADVKLVTKFVDLGSTGGYGFALYGFRNIGGSFGSFGTLSETANGSSNTTTSYLYSTSTDIKEVYWADQTTDTLYFTLDGNRSNSAFIWAKLKIGSTTFTRSTASYSYNSSTNRTTWSWATSTNPFGSTTSGTDVAIEVILDVNTGHTSSTTSKTITAGSTSDETYTFANASSTQQYRLIKSSGTIASGGGAGTVIDSRTGGGNLIVDYSNNELPPAGNNATYQLQVSGPYVSTTETESGFWINTTGQNNSFTITREAASVDTTPDQFTFTDVSNVTISTTQTSNTITISGMDTGASATVTITGGTYSKNSGAYTSSSGTASNGDTFSVRHTSSSSYNTAVNTVLTIGGVSDTYTSTTGSFSGATYYVDVIVTADLELSSLFIGATGTGVRTSSQNPLLLTAGDRVGFRYVSNDGSTITASAFNTGYWTNTGSLTLTTSYQYKYAASGLSITVPDAVNITATRSGYTGTTNTLYYMGDSEQPDITISLDNSVYEISSTDTSHTIVISDSGSSTNSSITEYRARSGATTFQSRTGPGSLTVNDVPPNDGFPKYYYLDARVTTANGGSGTYENVPGSSYSVIATTTQSSNNPTIDTYGIAIYDHNGNAITSFNGGHTTLREIYSNSSVTLSTTGTTDVNTGLTGITTSNCVIMVEGSGGSGATSAVNVPATFVGTNPVSVRLGRVSSAQTVKVTVAQHKGSTIGATNNYGFEIKNGDSDTVIDENSIVYGVKEIIALNPSASNQTLYQNDTTYFLYVELTQGAYPASGGIPIPAISSSKSVYLMPPSLTGTKHTDGSYKTVICYIPKAGTINGYYNLAMLVSADNATPSYYGGSAPSYGITISDSSSSLLWHSGWRQAIVNNVIVANQFTAGTNQNGTYDVTTGYDGVTAPLLTSTDFPFAMESTGQVKSLTGLNDMDPANTYLAGSSLTGSVAYYMGFWEDLEHNQTGYSGGGLHKPAVKITGFSTANINMYRYSQGPTPPTSNDYGARLSTSYHPEGNYILFRIV